MLSIEEESVQEQYEQARLVLSEQIKEYTRRFLKLLFLRIAY